MGDDITKKQTALYTVQPFAERPQTQIKKPRIITGFTNSRDMDISPNFNSINFEDMISNNSYFTVTYTKKIRDYVARVSVKNELNDLRNLIIRDINIYVVHKKDFEFKEICSAGFTDPTKTYYKDNLFVNIPILPAVNYIENGAKTKYEFIDSNKYIKLENNDEITFDVSFTLSENIVRLACISAICDYCKQSSFILFDEFDIYFEFIVDEPDFDDLSNKKMNRKVINELKIGAFGLTSN